MTLTKNSLLCLRTMSKYQATHSLGPNFTFELVVRSLESAKDKKMLGYGFSSMSFVHLTALFSYSQQVMVTSYGLAENCVICFAFGVNKPILVDWEIRVCRVVGMLVKGEDYRWKLVNHRKCSEVILPFTVLSMATKGLNDVA
ncbi:hypothetical protein L2E82_45348 [Cichorium intybus]|uniref:Uncharacterized protein n=1 Tax=Cichorium intybus TaxID=13427 RepID=A0ACB8ZTL4_CICIN|nr:hypothetical protein L2E82_45348 [Cichorium intybus]